jgi:hypothetical protein
MVNKVIERLFVAFIRFNLPQVRLKATVNRIDVVHSVIDGKSQAFVRSNDDINFAGNWLQQIRKLLVEDDSLFGFQLPILFPLGTWRQFDYNKSFML